MHLDGAAGFSLALCGLYGIIAIWATVVGTCGWLNKNSAKTGVGVFLYLMALFAMGRVAQQGLAVSNPQINDGEAFGKLVWGNVLDLICFTLFFCLKVFILMVWANLCESFSPSEHSERRMLRQRLAGVVLMILVIVDQGIALVWLLLADAAGNAPSGMQAYAMIYYSRSACSGLAAIGFLIAGLRLSTRIMVALSRLGISASAARWSVLTLGIVAFVSALSFALRVVLDILLLSGWFHIQPGRVFFPAYLLLEVIPSYVVVLGLHFRVILARQQQHSSGMESLRRSLVANASGSEENFHDFSLRSPSADRDSPTSRMGRFSSRGSFVF
mmetsp:Transcript_25771/g.59484  ORF Transcript_25771/g.59484 Transcript_25771/m.59484 type:complete len:329 (-) Transcript_25771:766-1752(-)